MLTSGPTRRSGGSASRDAGRAYRWRVIAWRARLPLLLAAVLATAGVVARPAPTGIATAPVVVARSTIGVGDEVSADDLTVVRWPRDIAPSGLGVDALVGRRALVAIPADFPVTPAMVSTSGLQGPDGTVAVPIELPSSWSGLLSPGARITILSIPDDGTGAAAPARQVATDATVLQIPEADQPASGLAVTQQTPLRVIVAVMPDEAADLTVAALSGALGVLLVE